MCSASHGFVDPQIINFQNSYIPKDDNHLDLYLISKIDICKTSDHISFISTCLHLTNSYALHGFISASKVITRVIQNCALLLSSLEEAVADWDVHEFIKWTNKLLEPFQFIQSVLYLILTIALTCPLDLLLIIIENSVK